MENTIQNISIDLLDDHPDNPRLIVRQDVVDGIAVQIEAGDGFDPPHALMVRPLNDRYQIIWGHHRKLAAIQAGLKEVPCWVREMTDDEAYLQLGFGNAQGEWKPIEIGLHALGIPEGEHGRGLKGGIGEYADKMGKNRGNMTSYRNGAKVLSAISQENVLTLKHFLDKAAHLAAIHKVPEELWPMLAEWVVTPKNPEKPESTPSVKTVGSRVKDIQNKIVGKLRGDDQDTPNEWEQVFLPIGHLTEIFLSDSKALPNTGELIGLADKVDELLTKNAQTLAPIHTTEKFHDWLREGQGNISWNVGELRAQQRDILTRLDKLVEVVYDLWLSCCATEKIAQEIGLTTGAVEELIERAKELYYDDIIPASRQDFNLWNFSTNDEKYGIDGFPGRIPGQIVENVLYFYTKPFDIVIDPMAGGGTTPDVCKAMRRRYQCYDIDPKRDTISEHDVTMGFPVRSHDCDMIFLDPPYWKQKKGDYSGDETNLANMPLGKFYSTMKQVFADAYKALCKGGHVAVIIGPTQSKGVIYDHALEFAEMLGKQFAFVNRVIVPYTTQQARPYDITGARKGRYMLKLYRDLLVFKKEG